jgi:uncharacterized protein YcnI
VTRLRPLLSLLVVAAVALLAAASAAAHAELLPATIVAGEGQLLTLVVPNERDDATTTRVAITLPEGFFSGTFVASPGWKRRLELAEGGAIHRVIWTAEGDAGSDGGLFQFVGRTESTGTFVLPVAQVYSDGSIVEWAGAAGSDEPAPTVEAKTSLGGDGTSALTIVALLVATAGVTLAAIALVRQAGRPAA